MPEAVARWTMRAQWLRKLDALVAWIAAWGLVGAFADLPPMARALVAAALVVALAPIPDPAGVATDQRGRGARTQPDPCPRASRLVREARCGRAGDRHGPPGSPPDHCGRWVDAWPRG